jgi:hypothetical protein
VTNYACISLGTFGALNALFALLNYSRWMSGYSYLKSWGLEATFLVWIFPLRSAWGLAEDVSAALVLASVIGILVFLRNRPLLVRCFVAMGSFVLFSYISAPQLNVEPSSLFCAGSSDSASTVLSFRRNNGRIPDCLGFFPRPVSWHSSSYCSRTTDRVVRNNSFDNTKI